jgi:type II secretory pathway pseudopilin PulG
MFRALFQIFREPKPIKKAYTLTEFLVVSSIVVILSVSGMIGYRAIIRDSVVSTLKNAVMLNVQLIQNYKNIHGVWVTEAEPGNNNLTTNEEMLRFGLSQRDLSDDFMVRVFEKNGYPHVIAREQIGMEKFKVKVSYYFGDNSLSIEDL